MNLLTRNSPNYHLLKHLLFILKHPDYWLHTTNGSHLLSRPVTSKPLIDALTLFQIWQFKCNGQTKHKVGPVPNHDITDAYGQLGPVPAAARFKTWVHDRSFDCTGGSTPARGMDVSLSLSRVNVVCCQVEVSVIGRSLVQSR